MASRNYTDLIAWKKAMELARTVHAVTSVLPAEERFGLTSQMRRAAVSIPANIAEGEGRRTRGEFVNLLSVAHGSIRELETHVILAEELRYLGTDAARDVLRQSSEVGRLVNGRANSLKR